MNILLSFPKSASDWLRYIAEFIFRQVTYDENHCGTSKLNFMLNRIGVGVQYAIDESAILAKYHDARIIPNEDCRIVLSLRSCDEVVFSFAYATEKPDMSLEEFVQLYALRMDDLFAWWIRNVVFYEHHEGEKMIVHYDKLVSQPTEEIQRFCNFLGLSPISALRMSEFLDSLDEHKNSCIKYKMHQKSRLWNTTFGKGQIYSRSFLTDEQRRHIHAVLRMHGGVFAEKYCPNFLSEG